MWSVLQVLKWILDRKKKALPISHFIKDGDGLFFASSPLVFSEFSIGFRAHSIRRVCDSRISSFIDTAKAQLLLLQPLSLCCVCVYRTDSDDPTSERTADVKADVESGKVLDLLRRRAYCGVLLWGEG